LRPREEGVREGSLALDEKKKGEKKNETIAPRKETTLANANRCERHPQGGGKVTYDQVIAVLIVRAVLEEVILILLGDVKSIRITWKHR